MLFKKLEIVGFKSFLEKTALYFEPGITAIVGPNGCGKSNIIDSIKWVLGEQSAKSLRGSKMEDVIFNGTDEKEPINMAEVSLTLSNKNKLLLIDSDEVVVSRRLFRSGESEYLINKTPVRLKDVSELFMGTGIGAEMYSIIEQGKIDLILSSRPEDRRYIFEEASGITKYKSRKKEAVRKLEDTDNNLLRVSDIISEVKRQIDSITRQAKKAERYKERFDRLRELEISLASYEYNLLTQEKEGIEARSAEIREEMHSLSSEVEDLRRQLNRQKASFAEIDEKFNKLQSDKFLRESQIEQNRNRVDLNKERIIELSARVESLKEEVGALEVRKENTGGFVQELESRYQAVSDSEDAKKDFLNEKEKRLAELELEIKQNEQRLQESKDKMVDCMSERSKSRNEVVRLTSDIQNRGARLRRLNIELEKVTGETSLVRAKLEEIKNEFKNIENKLNDTRLQYDKTLKEKGGLVLSLSSMDKELQDKRGALINLESKRSFLEDLIARHEGFTAGVKALLESMERGELQIEGIKGVLGNAIKAEKGYELAVEAALGEYVQCIISRDRESALKAAGYLTTNILGRATFAILDELPVSEEIDDKLLKIDGILGKLADFVNAEDTIRNAIKNLLRGVYVIEAIEDADRVLNRLSSSDREAIRLVTKKGQIARKGFITAGVMSPKGEDAAIIGRETRLKETIKEAGLVKSEISEMERNENSLKSRLEELERQLGTLGELLRAEELEHQNNSNGLSSVERENARLEEEISLLNLEKDEVDEEIRDSTSRKEELERKLREIESLESNTQSVLLNSQNFIKDFSKEREEAMVLIAQIKTELQALSKEKTGLLQNLNLQKESYETYARSLGQKSNEIDLSNKKKDELAQEVEELEAEIKKLSQELEALKTELIQITGIKSRGIAVIEDIEKRLNELYKVSNEKKDVEHNFEMQKTESGFKIETLKNRMAQIYKVDINMANREVDPSSDWSAIRREIDELNRRLESMGTVNLVAIEEHKELEDRFNFLCQQRDDLLQAKEHLQKAIAKINKTTRKLFLETFEKIQFEFRNYFRYLFGGGQADIFLLDASDVLESGIEIVARPPGKKLQSITLLSGGEKALTAISLIFAIFKVKPSPFCLLDEVDAPLDESNIDRFSKALREFTKKSQFIVITHNKITITLADVMYGITMEKSGISKIVSVKFHDEARRKSEIPEARTIKEEEVLT